MKRSLGRENLPLAAKQNLLQFGFSEVMLRTNPVLLLSFLVLDHLSKTFSNVTALATHRKMRSIGTLVTGLGLLRSSQKFA